MCGRSRRRCGRLSRAAVPSRIPSGITRRRRSRTACSAAACEAWAARTRRRSLSVCCARRWQSTRMSAPPRRWSSARASSASNKSWATRALRWKSRRSAPKPRPVPLATRIRARVVPPPSTRTTRACAHHPIIPSRVGRVPAASRPWLIHGRPISRRRRPRPRLVLRSTILTFPSGA